MVHATPVAPTVAVGVVALLQVWRVAGISRVEPRHVVWQGQQAAGLLSLHFMKVMAMTCSPSCSHPHSLILCLSHCLSRSFSNDACCNEMSLVLHSAMHLKWAAFLKGCPVAIAARQCVISRLNESGGGRHKEGIFRGDVAAVSRDYFWLTENSFIKSKLHEMKSYNQDILF